MATTPTEYDRAELLLSSRYGDLEDIQQFVTKFGPGALAYIHDENANTILHMVAANGHTDVLDYILPLVPPGLLSAQNNAKSTPLHWAALNAHLEIMKKLVQFPGGLGVGLIDIKNTAGRSPLGEAENAGWEEGASWLVAMMKLDDSGEPGVKEAEGDVVEDGDGDGEPAHDIEVEIEDADGQVARVTISGREKTAS